MRQKKKNLDFLLSDTDAAPAAAAATKENKKKHKNNKGAMS